MRVTKPLITFVLSLLTLEAAQSRLWKSSYEEIQPVAAAPTNDILLDKGIHDASYVLQENRRVLNTDDEFQKQDCNLGSNGWYEFSPCVDWETLFPQNSDEEIVIPCGACVTMRNYKNNEFLNLGGLNILGKLVIPNSSKLTLRTPYIFAQGVLKMTSTAQVGEDPKIRIVLTGDDEVSFVPNGVNADLCPSGGCNVGSRPVIVAGGRLDLLGLKPGCPTWSYSSHITTVAEFVDSTDNYVEYEEVPLEFNFTDGIGLWFGNLGAKAAHVPDGPSPHLKVYDRVADWQGPFFDIPIDTRSVMAVGHNYGWSAKVKLSRDDGEPIKCVTNSTNCLSLMINRMDSQDRIAWYTKAENIPVQAADTWEEIGGTFKYQADEINVEHVFSALTFRGPEAGVDISLDDFKVSNRDKQLALENTAQGISVCENLIENGSGDDYADEGLPFPFTSWFKAEELTLETEENGNNYFYLKDRHVSYSTIKMNLETQCTVAGSKYQFNMRMQVESTATVRPRVMMKITHPDGYERKHSFDLIALCDPVNQNEGWVDCYRSEYTFTEEHETAVVLEVLVVIPDDESSSVKYDDISFVPYTGVKLPRSTNNCWGPDSKVLLASKGAYDQEETARIESSDDGSITFKSPITLPSPNSGGEQYPNEIALLSRNIMFKSDSNTSGGHLTVLRTSDRQKIDGVAFKGFGQEGVADRFPIHFDEAGSSHQTKVERNSITDSHNRCIVLSGTSDARIADNVAYDTKGHCYVVGEGSNNFFSKNLGALTQPPTSVIDGESDFNPATFYITNTDNSFTNNVAAGSADTGFWFHLQSSMTRVMRLFTENVSHSNKMGLKTYPGDFSSPHFSMFLDTKVYRNTEKGMYFHDGHNILIKGGLVADNPVGIDVEFTDNVVIESVEVYGNTGFSNPCPTNTESLIGVKISPNFQVLEDTGTVLQDVTFKHIDDSSCAESVGAFINENKISDTFNNPVSFIRLHFENVTTTFSACDAIGSGLSGMTISDNGSLNPSGNIIGELVSGDKKSSYNTCLDLDAGVCASYCYNEEVETDDCHRTVIVEVSPESDTTTKLVVEEGADVIVENGVLSDYDDDKFWDNRLSYTLSLPPGSFSAHFQDGSSGAEVWPKFAEVIFGDEPKGCTFVLDSIELNSLAIGEDTCDNLITNGDFSSGADNWFHNGCGLKLVDGYSGQALSTQNRANSLEGIAQFLDTRCMVNGTKYEVVAKVQMESVIADEIATCSYQLTGAGEDRCPRLNIKSSKSGETPYVALAVGRMTLPWNDTDWNYLFGSFTVTPELVEADNVIVYFDGPGEDNDIIVEDVRVYSYDSICDDLVTNGDFYEGTKDWSFIGPDTGLVLADGVEGSGLSTINRAQWFFGMSQQIDARCLKPDNIGRVYEVYADVRLTDEEGYDVGCNPFVVFFNPQSCPVMALRLLGDNNVLQEIREIGQPIGPWPDDGSWSKIYGTFTMTADLVYDQENLNYYFLKAWAGVNIVIDNVSIKETDPPEDECENLIKNGDAETGDARFWYIKGSGAVGEIEMVEGASGSWAFHHFGDRGQLFNGMMQKLDKSCIPLNSDWKISFKMKLMDNAGVGVSCDKTLAGYVGADKENCPEIYIESKTLNGGTKITSLANEHPAETWDADNWNEFETSFTMIRAHRILDDHFIFIHKVKTGYAYMIDDFKMVPVSSG